MCLAIPGKIKELFPVEDPVTRSGKVSFGGIIKNVNLSMVPEAEVGDYVLVHVGVAISIVDEEEAKKTMQYLKESGDLDDLSE